MLLTVRMNPTDGYDRQVFDLFDSTKWLLHTAQYKRVAASGSYTHSSPLCCTVPLCMPISTIVTVHKMNKNQ